MISEVVSHYRVLEELGRGGMGLVYKAQDLRLHRHVALKFLNDRYSTDPKWLALLRHEAMTVSSLNHPNICTIHDIDEHDNRLFIVMELLNGQSLQRRIDRGPLTLPEVMEIAAGVLDGLDAAHQSSLVHRDLKPANVFVTDDLHVKLLDFGLASRPVDEGKDSQAETSLRAAADLISQGAGTPAYMSPEQIRGDVTDSRSDIFSFGCMLFEMMTGESLFLRPTRADTLSAVTHGRIAWPASGMTRWPQRLLDLVEKALEKDVELRYQSARDILVDMKRIRRAADSKSHPSSPAPARPAGLVKGSIAVLPFQDLSADQDQGYFCDGVAEELIHTLTRLDGLSVTGRTSAFALRGTSLGVRQIGEQLRVETVLEGSVRRAGDRIRVAASLINVEDGFTIWAESYNRSVDDIFVVQEELARSIVKALAVRLVEGDDRLISHGTDNIEAYQLYLRGLHAWNRRTDQALTESLTYFGEALNLAPDFAMVYAAMADAYYTFGEYGVLPPHDVMPKAQASARRAIELNPRLGAAHGSLGLVLAGYNYDWPAADAAFKEAIRLNPGHAGVRHWYGMYLSWMGRFDEALREIQRAQTLDPLSPPVNWARGAVLTFARRPDDAIREYRQMAVAAPGFFGWHLGMGDAWLQKGNPAEAAAAFEEARRLSEKNVLLTGMLGYAWGKLGRREDARALVVQLQETSRMRYVSPISLYLIEHGCGNITGALDLLERCYEERSSLLVRVGVDHKVDDLRTEPRFQKLLSAMNLRVEARHA